MHVVGENKIRCIVHALCEVFMINTIVSAIGHSYLQALFHSFKHSQMISTQYHLLNLF